MNTEQDFLQAVCAEPDDDGPRLVFADWLEDNGQPERAEFIRSQCRRAKMDEWDDGYEGLAGREQELLEKDGKAWGKEALKFTKRVEWRRGFVDGMTLEPEKFVDCAEAIFAATPLRSLRLVYARPAWDALVACPGLARLRVLEVYFQELGVARTQALAGCEHLANLHELNYGLNKAGRSVEGLLRSPHLRDLRRLRLNKNETGDAVADWLARAGPRPHLRALDLAGNGIRADGVRRLAGIDWLGQLEHLGLAECPFGDEGLRALAGSGAWASLRELNVTDCGLGESSGPILVGCRQLRGLRVLVDDSAAGGLGASDLTELMRSPVVANLRVLRLRRLSLASARALLRSPALAGLRVLEFSVPGEKLIGELGRLLREAAHLTNLRHLTVNGCRLDGKRQ
jgi:uncharacterized protein (TIGR02996 family)